MCGWAEKAFFFEALGGVCALCRKLLHSDKLLKHLHFFFSTCSCSLSFHFLFLNINFFGRDQCAPISVKCPRTHKEVAKKLFFSTREKISTEVAEEDTHPYRKSGNTSKPKLSSPPTPFSRLLLLFLSLDRWFWMEGVVRGGNYTFWHCMVTIGGSGRTIFFPIRTPSGPSRTTNRTTTKQQPAQKKKKGEKKINCLFDTTSKVSPLSTPSKRFEIGVCALSAKKRSNTNRWRNPTKKRWRRWSVCNWWSEINVECRSTHLHKPPVSIKVNAIVNNLKEEEEEEKKSKLRWRNTNKTRMGTSNLKLTDFFFSLFCCTCPCFFCFFFYFLCPYMGWTYTTRIELPRVDLRRVTF